MSLMEVLKKSYDKIFNEYRKGDIIIMPSTELSSDTLDTYRYMQAATLLLAVAASMRNEFRLARNYAVQCEHWSEPGTEMHYFALMLKNKCDTIIEQNSSGCGCWLFIVIAIFIFIFFF